MTSPREPSHTASSPLPASRSTGSGSLPSSPSSTSLAIRAINPSPVKRVLPPTASTDPPPAPPAPPRASLNLALSNPSLPAPVMRHTRSVSGALSSLLGRRELAPPPDSPASDCATRASSPSPPLSPTSATSVPFSHAPTSPIKLNVAHRSTATDPGRPRAAAPPSTSRDKATSTAAQLAPSSPAPPSPKVIAKRKRRFLLHLLWRRKKGGAGAQDGVAVPRSVRAAELRESARGGGGAGGEREDVAAWVSTIGSGVSRAQGEVFGGGALSSPAQSEDDESSLGGKMRTAGGGKAVAAVYYASLPTPYRCSPSFKHLHARATTALSSTSLHRKKPLRHSPSSLRKVMNRPRPVERRTSTIGLFSFGHGFGHEVCEEKRSGEGRTAGGQAGVRGEEEQSEDDEASAELDDGDSDFEDVEPDLGHLARRRFTRSPAPSPASSRFLRSPPTGRRLALSSLSFHISPSIDTSQGRSSPVWYASSRARADPPSGTTPADGFDRRSSFDAHGLDSLRDTLSPASSRPTSAAGSTRSSASDTSAQDLATAQIVVQAHSRARSSVIQHGEQGGAARRRSSVGTVVTIVPRLGALEPVSPFKPRFEALDGDDAGDLREAGTAQEEPGSPRTAATTPTATDPAGALAHLRSPAFRLDSGDGAALAALRRAGEDVFGSASAAAAAARPAPLWGGEQRALGPPGSAAPGERALVGAGPQSPGSPDSVSTVRGATGAAEGGGWKMGGEAARGARRVLGERQV